MLEQSLRKKILDLFNYREFPFLFELTKEPKSKIDHFIEKLVDLQASIYYLDAHLESNWLVDDHIINACWDDIYNNTIAFNVSKAQAESFTSHIRKYQKHELELRKNALPTRFKMEFFYFYKSCDVKLLRKLIYLHFPMLSKHASLADWRYFDLVTEINDDVEDIFEDMDTINGNRLLIALHENDPGMVRNQFEEFLKYILFKSKQRFKDRNNELCKLIQDKTENNVIQTISLLENNINLFRSMKKSTVKLFHQLETVFPSKTI